MLSRRSFTSLVAMGAISPILAQDTQTGPQDWHCPMDPDVRSDKPGVCPRCGMKLTLQVPDLVEYQLELKTQPKVIQPHEDTLLIFRVRDPRNGELVSNFEIVHEKLIHLFIVSENLQYFAHVHPEKQGDGSFKLLTRFPYGGMYRLMTDYYPHGSTPQLTSTTLFVKGVAPEATLAPDLAPCHSENLTATLETDPAQLIAGLEAKLFYTLNPAEGLQPYLGVWSHMLAVSQDLIDMLHIHPFIANGGPKMQFNVLFPRPSLYRIWAQFERQGTVNTTTFTLPVSAL